MMNNCDVITLSSDDENTPVVQDKYPLKQVREIPQKLPDEPEKRWAAGDDTYCANKPNKRVHPVCIAREPKMEKEDQFKFFTQTLKLMPDKNEEHGNQTIFDKFLKLCQQNNQSPEMETILHKAQTYYIKAKPDYISSQEFENLVTCKMSDIKNKPCSVYVYIKDVVDEIKVRRLKNCEPPSKRQKTCNGSLNIPNNSNVVEPGCSQTEQEDEDKVRKNEISALVNAAESRYKARKIKKLSKAVKQLQKRIEKLEEKEVDFDEDNDSAYIRLERYKDRICKVYQKLCELTGDSCGDKATRRRIAFSGTKSSDINRCIERFVNKTGQFPDFHDILSLVKSVQADVNMKPEEVRRIAEEAFVSVGRQLQKQRQYESWDSLSVFLKDQADPAENNPDLESKLQDNYKEYAPRIQSVIDSFAEKQVAEKLMAEEVPDEDANKSEDSGPEEREEEEEGEDEKDFVEKVLRGEEDLSLDEDTETENHEETEKYGVLADEDGYKSSHVFPGQEENPVEMTSDCIRMQEPLALHTQSCCPSATIADDCRAGQLGPVSPPILGEDLSKRGLYHVKLPSDKEYNSSEEKSDGCNFLSDTKCLSSFHSSEHNLHVSESCLSPSSTIPHSEQYKKSVSEPSVLPGITDSDSVSHHSGQQDTSNSRPSLCTAIIKDTDNLQQYKSVKPELSSASVIENDANSYSPHLKQHDIPKTEASLPTFTTEGDAESSDGDRASPSLLMQRNTSELDSSVENSDSSGTIIVRPTNLNVNGVKSKSKSNSDLTVCTTLTSNEFISSKFVVTKMEVKSDTESRVTSNKPGKMIRPPRKFVRKLGISSFGKQEHGSIKSVPPDVITLE